MSGFGNYSSMPNVDDSGREYCLQGDCDAPTASIRSRRLVNLRERHDGTRLRDTTRYLESKRLDVLWAAYVAEWGTGTSHAALTAYIKERGHYGD